MKDNDLSAAPTPRYWVMADVVFLHEETKVETRRLFGRTTTTKILQAPDMAVLSLLWRFSARLGVRLELVFVGDMAVGAGDLWDMLDRTAANPFSDWQAVQDLHQILRDLPYRPDLMGIIARPIDSAIFGGRGLTIANIQ